MRNVATRLRTVYGECFFDGTLGIPWIDLLGQKSQDKVVLSVKQEIGDCYGIMAVTDVQYQLDDKRKLTIQYAVNTLYSRGVMGTVTI